MMGAGVWLCVSMAYELADWAEYQPLGQLVVSLKVNYILIFKWPFLRGV